MMVFRMWHQLKYGSRRATSEFTRDIITGLEGLYISSLMAIFGLRPVSSCLTNCMIGCMSTILSFFD